MSMVPVLESTAHRRNPTTSHTRIPVPTLAFIREFVVRTAPHPISSVRYCRFLTFNLKPAILVGRKMVKNNLKVSNVPNK